MKGFKSTSTNPYTYTQSGVWKKGQYTFQAVVLSDSGYAFAFQRSDTTWQTVDLSWQVKEGSYSKIQWTFTLEVDAVAFRLIANTVTGETTVLQPMLEKGSNGSTPIAHEEDLRGMDGDDHEFIFTRNTTGVAPETPLSTQDDDYEPEGWTDNPQGVTPEIPYEFVSMREKKNGVWLDFSPPSLWAKWGEDGLSVNLLVEGHYKSHWEGTTKVVEIVGGVDVGGSEVVKVSAVFRKGEENIAATVSQSRGFQWHVNGVHLTAFDNQPFITLDETYGDGFADYVVLSYLVNSIREEERREIINISGGMDGIGEEFIFKANNSDTVPPVLPQTTDVGYQNDDYHGDWSDDPVAPTELNQFVWVAKRKKIGGIWEAFGTPSIWTKWVTDGEPGADGDDGADGAPGADGHSPYINETTGTWWEWNDATGQYENTGYSPVGSDGAIPYPAGYYDSAATYTRTTDAAPYVQYGETLYLVKDVGSVPAGTLPTNTTYWKAFNQWEAVFITSLVAKFAKIGGAVFTGDTSDVSSSIRGRLISEKGVDGTTNYNTYTGDSSTWQPKLMLDFLNGKSKFTEAEITGIIHALSGDIGGFDIANKRIGTVADEHSSTGNGLAIYDDFIKFSKRIADADGGSVPEDSYVWVGIGENVFPASTGSRGLARYENHEQQGYWGTEQQTFYTYSAYQAAGSPTPVTFYYYVYDDVNQYTGHTYSTSTYYTDAQIESHVYPFIYGGYFQYIIADVPVWYPYLTNYGVIIDVKGAAENIALDLYSGSIAGLAIRTRQISSGTTLTRQDVYVSCYNTSTITVYLPANPQVGKIIFVHRVNEAGITVNGNGKTILWGSGSGISINTGGGAGKGDTGVYVYDGQYWQYNYLVRKPG